MGTKRITCKFCGEYMKSYDLYVSHIESSHSESIPQDMTAWRFVYYLKTGKTHGSCIICKNETEWNEKTHKYHRFCNNPKCKEKYVETFRNRMIGKYGKVNLLNDPEQQKKMLANRKISGVYIWRDHVHETTYTGTYELSFLKFLDEVLEFNPEDVIGPSPHTYYYIYEGKKHFYIPDFFIPSLNLEIEIKEGTNNHPKIQAVDKVKERLKDEVMKSNSNSFNYIKIIEKNNFRFIEFLDEAKKRFLNGDKRPIVMCESVEDNLFDELITENKIINDKDIYYNKDKFDSGEINLCFITGHSGSGKSSMGRDMESDRIEHYDLDDVISNWNFSDSNLKEYGDLIYSFFRGSGKKYRYISRKDWDNDPTWDNKNPYKDAYEISIIKDFIKYTKSYVNSHKNIKFVIEGVWIFHFIEPKEIDNYAVYIKGTSQAISSIRAAKRDSEGVNKFKKSIDFTKQITSPGRTKKYIHDEQKVVKFRNYFKDKIKKQKIITETVEDNLFDDLITENISDKYIRITYNGNGIYQEFKENVSFNIWKEFKNSNATKWLPIPPAYEGNYKSYFTIKGYKMFMKETYPFIIKYLDKNKIKVEEIHFNDSPNVVYEDEFQIVVDGNSDIITESNKSHLYHISNRQNIKTINPSIPNNFMTKNNYEENKTKRVCFAPSIEQCLMGLSRNCEGEEFYVYIPIKDYKTYSPNIKDVPDSGITEEIWIKEPVDVICIGKIKVLDTNKTPGKLYTYGNGQTAELYAFDYKWIEKYK